MHYLTLILSLLTVDGYGHRSLKFILDADWALIPLIQTRMHTLIHGVAIVVLYQPTQGPTEVF